MYLTFDVGTTSVKTSLFDGQGRLMGKSIENYELQSPQVDWYEVEPELYWKAVLEGFRETLRESGVALYSQRFRLYNELYQVLAPV